MSQHFDLPAAQIAADFASGSVAASEAAASDDARAAAKSKKDLAALDKNEVYVRQNTGLPVSKPIRL